MNYWLILIPLTAALIGWITNFIMIQLLFYPRQPKKILGFQLQGLLPKIQQQFAPQIGKAIDSSFLSMVNIEEKINNPDNLKKVMPVIENHIDDFLRNRLKQEMPMVGMLIGDKTIDTMKKLLLKEIEAIFPKVMDEYASNLKANLNLEGIITEKIQSVPPDNLEQMLRPVIMKETRSIGLIGAIIGFVIGLLQVAIICFFS